MNNELYERAMRAAAAFRREVAMQAGLPDVELRTRDAIRDAARLVRDGMTTSYKIAADFMLRDLDPNLPGSNLVLIAAERRAREMAAPNSARFAHELRAERWEFTQEKLYRCLREQRWSNTDIVEAELARVVSLDSGVVYENMSRH